MTAALDATEVAPRMRPYKAVRLTKENINDPAVTSSVRTTVSSAATRPPRR